MVSAIDTAANAVVNSVSVGVGANFMLYDSTRNRLYVANPANNTVTYLDASSDALSAVVIPLQIRSRWQFCRMEAGLIYPVRQSAEAT